MEHVLQDQVHYSRRLSVTCHCVALSRSRGSIGKDTRIEAFEDGVDKMRASFLIYLLSSLLVVEDPVEVIPLLTRSVKHVWLFTLVFTLHLNSVKNNLIQIINTNAQLTSNLSSDLIISCSYL